MQEEGGTMQGGHAMKLDKHKRKKRRGGIQKANVCRQCVYVLSTFSLSTAPQPIHTAQGGKFHALLFSSMHAQS